MLTIPFFDAAAFTEEITLDGTPHVFHFTWNARGEYWLLDLSSLEGEPLLEGVKIVPNEDLLAGNAGRPVPPGQLRAVAAFDPVERVGRDDLPSGRVELVYITEAEIENA